MTPKIAAHIVEVKNQFKARKNRAVGSGSRSGRVKSHRKHRRIRPLCLVFSMGCGPVCPSALTGTIATPWLRARCR